MKELNLIETIKKTLNSSIIGDDCAFLEDLEITITQDSLVEDVHFSREFCTPFELGYKSVAVNLSDIYASGAEAKYLTISLSLPKNIDEKFVEDFYKGAKSVNPNVQIVGGDITGSEKIFISICAIGNTKNRRISSRKNAKYGYKIITNGTHGSSGAGLYMLQNGLKTPSSLIKAHLMPEISNKLSDAISKTAKFDYAMMDSSDGLMDALYKIASSSNVLAEVDLKKIPIDKELKELANIDYKQMVFYGAEDYKLVCAISDEDLSNIDPNLYTIIGFIKEKDSDYFVEINDSSGTLKIDKSTIEKNLYNHF